MAHEPKKWALGLIPLVAIWAIGLYFQEGKVEIGLADGATKSLGSDLVDNAAVTARGRDVSLSGLVFSEAGRADAVAAAEGVYGVRLADASAMTLPPEAKPYMWSATRDGGKISMSGSQPNPKAKSTAMGMANAIAPSEDATTYARGASETFPMETNFALRELALLSKGTASIGDDKLTISGVATDGATYEKALAALKTPPVGMSVASADILPPFVKPYVFTAVNTGAGVALSGSAPSTMSRDAIRAAAEAAFPGGKIDNGLTLAGGAPQGNFDAVAGQAVATIAKLTDGKAVLTDDKLVISGRAVNFATADAAAEMRGPPGFSVDTSGVLGPSVTNDNIAAATAELAANRPPLDIAGCQDDLHALLSHGSIQFDTGSATISNVSYQIVVKLAAVALRCQVQSIEVSGHTDSQGDENFNQQLSKARADAVVALLVKAGVPAPMLTSAGYGSLQPIADNATEGGRAMNRRIEFNVH